MKQTKNGQNRTALIREQLTKRGKFLMAVNDSLRIIERWQVGKQFFLLEVYPAGYNLYQTPAGDNNIEADIAAIQNAK